MLLHKYVVAKPDRRVLEAGCGTGGNLSLLSAYGQVDALEYDDEARHIAANRKIGRIAAGSLPDAIGFGAIRYDLVALLDVLEHVDDDVAALASLGHRLSEEGRLLVTVPAAPWLWSQHDVLHHHKRRYTLKRLTKCALQAGLKIEAAGHFNSLLFPLACWVRMTQGISGRSGGQADMPSTFINALLRRIFMFERWLIGRITLPIRLSVYVVLSRAEG